MTENELATSAGYLRKRAIVFSKLLSSRSSKRWSIYTISRRFSSIRWRATTTLTATLSAKSAGHKLRYDLIKAIEALKPQPDIHFRDPVARLYNILHMYYVEGLNIQATAAELGLSERQAYRDLRRGQERVAAVLWNNRLPPPKQQEDFSLESEVARLRLSFNPVDMGEVFQQAERGGREAGRAAGRPSRA